MALPQFSTAPMSASIGSPPHLQPAPPPTAQQTRRHRPAQSRSSRDEDVIGLVLVDKKFRCTKHDCKDLTFGRLADLHRHYNATHARHRVQYFCPYEGCPRSAVPATGKGRSFGTRKDKKDEHVRNVHQKEHKNSRDPSYSPTGAF